MTPDTLDALVERLRAWGDGDGPCDEAADAITELREELIAARSSDMGRTGLIKEIEGWRNQADSLRSELVAERLQCSMAITESDSLRSSLARLTEANERLQRDAGRLDLIERNGIGCDRVPLGDTKFDVWHNGIRYSAKTPREAIDAAIAAQGGE